MRIIKDDNTYGSFSLSNLFVTEYLTGLSGDAVKLYIYFGYLHENRKDTSESALLNVLQFSAERLKNAVSELTERELIAFENGTLILSDVTELKLKKRYGSISTSGCTLSSENNSELDEVIRTVQCEYFGGKMTRKWYELIRSLGAKLDPEVILLLFQHCEQYCEKPLKKAYVEKVAENWQAENIKSAKDLQEYLDVRAKLGRFVDFIRKKMNRNAPFMDSEISVMRKWLLDYGYGEDELSVVLDWTRFNNPTIGAFDKLITTWHGLGLKNAAEIKDYLEKNKKTSGSDKKATSGKSDKTGFTSPVGNFTQREYSDDFFTALTEGRPYKKTEDNKEEYTEGT